MESESLLQKPPSPYHFDSVLNEDNTLIALQQLAVTQQVFCTHLLLETIFLKLDKKTLLGCRSVSQAWNERARKIFRKRKPPKIEIHFPDFLPRNEFQAAAFSSSYKSAETKLELLTETIGRNTQLESTLPHCQFRIVHLPLQNVIAQNFFSKCGFVIQNFHVIFPYELPIDCSEFLEHLANLLYNQLPNLTRLRLLVDHPSLENKTTDFFKQFFSQGGSHGSQVFRPRLLPKLKQMQFSTLSNALITAEILHSAVNLEDIRVNVMERYGMATIAALIAQRKTHLVSCLWLCLDEDVLLPIKKLAESHLRIRTVTLNVYDVDMSQECTRRAGKIIKKLLTAISESLEILDMPPFLLFPAFPIPPMAKLHSLTFNIVGINCQHQPLYPMNFKMSQVFPRLNFFSSHVRVCARMDDEMFKPSLLGVSYSDQVSTLRSIEFMNQPDEISTRSFSKMFPHLVHVKMGVLHNIPLAFNAFWNLAHLRKLEFGIVRGSRYDEEIKESVAQELETAFTGFSNETCIRMRLAVQSDRDRDQLDLLTTLESLRVTPSMLDAKSLRELRIRIDDCYKNERTIPRDELLSCVTGQFAFKMCPVEVHIEVYAFNTKNTAALMADVQPVVPYVSSVKNSPSTNLSAVSGKYFLCSSCQL